MRRVKRKANVADLRTKPLCKAVIAEHCFALGYVNMAEGTVWCKRQYLSIFCNLGSFHKIVTGGRNSARSTQ